MIIGIGDMIKWLRIYGIFVKGLRLVFSIGMVIYNYL